MKLKTALTGLITALLLTSLLLIPAVSASAELTIDTTGLIGKTTDTILVPVVLTADTPVAAYQFNINAGDTDTAKIAFSRDSVLQAGAASGDQTVYWYTTDAGKYLTGEKTLLYLAVTPKIDGEINLELSNVYIYETSNGQRTEADTTVTGGILTVSGTGTGSTIGDSQSGATMIYGPVSKTDGSYNTGETAGIKKLEFSETRTGYAIINYGSMGVYPAPEGIGYFSLYDIASDANAGEPITVTFGITEVELNSVGKTAEDIFVLHNIHGEWYQSTITSPQLVNGAYTFSAQTWANSPTFLTGYDTGGKTFKQETKDIAAGKTEQKTPVVPILIGAAILLIAVAATVIAVKKKSGR